MRSTRPDIGALQGKLELSVGARNQERGPLKVAGLFAGIGGIEQGLRLTGHEASLLCEIDPHAQQVLRRRFPGITLEEDVRTLGDLRGADLIAAGFPCQDLSQAGETKGIGGSQSGLVREVFRLAYDVEWVLLENVSFMLHLGKGGAMRFIIESLEEQGFNWAYRVVDSRSFGLPQRRQRVILLASRNSDPRHVLLSDDAGAMREDPDPVSFGFYWTEGIRGLGWAVEAIPTLKGGSTIGIPSAPAIWNRANGTFGLPDIRDAERLQGFDSDWTSVGDEGRRREGFRWKLVGNAVSVPMAAWIGRRLRTPGLYNPAMDRKLQPGRGWPRAAWGIAGDRRESPVSMFPLGSAHPPLSSFLRYPLTPLSERATRGFLKRTTRSRLRFPDGFLPALWAYAGQSSGHVPVALAAGGR